MALVAHWRMEDSALATVEDSAGSYPLAATGSPSLIAGVYGTARRFTGASLVDPYTVPQYATIASTALRSVLYGAFTFAAWVWRPAVPVEYTGGITGNSTLGVIFAAGDTSQPVNYGVPFRLAAINNTPQGLWDVAGVSQSLLAASAFPLNAWTHVAFVKSDAGGGQYSGALYVDGALAASGGPYGNSSNATGDVYLGCAYVGAPFLQFDGALDDVRIYNEALTAAQVATLGAAPVALLNPASDLANAVTTQTLSSLYLVRGRNLFAGEIPPNITMGVFLLNAGGETPEPYCGSDSQSMFRSTVTMMVRGVPGSAGYLASEALARAVLGFLHLRSVSGYVAVRAMHPHPDFIGNDELERPQWTAQLSCWFKA